METVVIGEITGVYGVKGWLRLKSWTEPREQIFAYQPWHLSAGQQDHQRECRVAAHKAHGGQFVVSLDGVSDRDAAAQLIGQRVQVARNRLPELPDNEYYWAELLGMQVVNLSGDSFGKVSNLLETGANDVLVINGDRQRLVPFVRDQVVKQVDQSTDTITVDWDADF